MDTTFKVKWSKVKVTEGGAYCGGLPHSLLLLLIIIITDDVTNDSFAIAAGAAADDDDDMYDDDAVDYSQTLEVLALRYPADTGAYKCTAENDAGSAQDIATVFVQQHSQPAPSSSSVTGTNMHNACNLPFHVCQSLNLLTAAHCSLSWL